MANLIPISNRLIPCEICKKRYVPEIILATCEIPPDILTTGRANMIEARVCRKKKPIKGEANAIQLSEALPFIEYDLHRQLMLKLKLYGMNAAFGLSQQLSE